VDIGYGEENQRAAQELGCGKWVKRAGVSSDLVGEYTQADVVQLGGAVGAAHATFAPWACTTPKERHDILLRAPTEILTGRDELARLLAREGGKTLLESAYATARLLSAASLKHYPGRGRIEVRRRRFSRLEFQAVGRCESRGRVSPLAFGTTGRFTSTPAGWNAQIPVIQRRLGERARST
jgi:acyl-CoA reductase-like NAD-dependent aldehyde dehydrogenase